jgi:transposase
MNRKERDRITILVGINQGKLTLAAAAPLLGLCYRQTRRVWQRYQAQGEAGLVHRLRDRPSPRRKPAGLRARVLARYRQRYPDFGPTLAAEYLAREDDLKVDHETLRRWLLAEGLRSVRRRRQQHRQWRERKACFGEMVQLDGSHHDWLEGRRAACVLMVMVDDATNRVRARFFEEETTHASYDTLESWVRRHRVPRALYVDRDSIYRCEGAPSVAEQLAGKEAQTQFGRAMEQLGVKLILARSPQAKGRVERMNGVLQDRLVKALRLAGISDLEEANRYLDKHFLPELNRRLERKPAQPIDLHQAVPGTLDEILSWEEPRVVQRDWTVACGGRWYQLDRRHESLSLVGRKVIVRRLRDGQEQIVYRGQKLHWRPLPARPAPARPQPRPMRPVRHSQPAADHPWRRFGVATGRRYWRSKRPNRSEIPSAPIRAGGAGPLRSGDRRQRELGLESRRRRPPARSNRRRGHALRTTNKGDILS